MQGAEVREQESVDRIIQEDCKQNAAPAARNINSLKHKKANELQRSDIL